MPGIIVSRPIFNTLFKLAHEEGMSINAFLTRLLENAGPDAVKQVATGKISAVGADTDGFSADSDQAAESGTVEIVGTEQLATEFSASVPAGQNRLTAAGQNTVRPIEYDDQHDATAPTIGIGVVPETGEAVPGRRIGNSIWDKVVSMEGRRFSTSRGKKFSYKVTGEYIVVRHSAARIPRSQFDKAQKMWPVSGPSRLVGVYAPSVVWAVMREASEATEKAEPAAV